MHFLLRKYLLLVLSVGVIFSAMESDAQLLSRRPFIGLDLRWNAEEELLEITHVYQGSAAERAGLLPGDRLLSLDHVPLNSYAQLFQLIKKERKVGDKIILALRRNGQVVVKKLRLGPYPVEQAVDFQIDYREVLTPEGRLRCIVTIPPQTPKPVPTVFFIQGVACESIDNPFDTTQAYLQLLYDLTRRGLATVRIEKFGIGDSEGPDCREVDFYTERSAYLSALQQLKQYDFVDTARVILLGHSVGGIIAVQIAQQEPVRGIVVYGTVGRRWTDYLLESRRRLFFMHGKSEAELDEYLTGINRCNVQYFILHQAKEQVASENPRYERYLNMFDIRQDSYWFQLQEVNIPAEWGRYNGFLLSLWGEFDLASLEEDHQTIASIVEKKNPGKAIFMRVPQADHGMRWAVDHRKIVAPYNPLVGHLIAQWIESIAP